MKPAIHFFCLRIPSRALIVVASLMAGLVISACANQPRPTAAEWLPKWEAAVAAVPDEAAVGEDPPAGLCTDTLAALRAERPGLTTTPDLAIDDTVQVWFQIAEDAFFECPPRSDVVGSFSEAYMELSRLESEIDAALGLSE
ncbi:MAG: hypothetical protein JJE47_04715 [Acidimicrobiia bacterium]|nr:hypothetical protein [Acidimicrobiia bacterium]